MIHDERNTGKTRGNTTIGRQEMQQKVRRRENIVPFCIDGRKRKRIKNLNLLAAGHNNIVVTWTILQLLTYHTSQHRKSDQSMKTCLCLNSMMVKSRNMSNRDDFPHAARMLAVLERQQGRENPYISKTKRERQRPLDEQLRSELEWQSLNNRKIYKSQASSSSSTDWW